MITIIIGTRLTDLHAASKGVTGSYSDPSYQAKK